MITRTLIDSKATGTYEVPRPESVALPRWYPSAYTGIEGSTSCRGGTRRAHDAVFRRRSKNYLVTSHALCSTNA